MRTGGVQRGHKRNSKSRGQAQSSCFTTHRALDYYICRANSKMRLTTGAAALLAATPAAIGNPIQVEERASCPNIHVFGARETTAPAGYGSAGTFVNLILQAYPGSTAEAINYPAAGGTNAQYASSVQQGTQNVANQINSFNQQCPSTKLVVVGYSQVSICLFSSHARKNNLRLDRVRKSRIMLSVAEEIRTKGSHTRILSSPPPPATPSKPSFGLAIRETHRPKPSTMEVALLEV